MPNALTHCIFSIIVMLKIELMKAFPRFSWYRICGHAKEHSICRNRSATSAGPWQANPYHRTVTSQDLEAAAGLVSEPAEQDRMREVANELAKQTLRGKLSCH